MQHDYKVGRCKTAIVGIRLSLNRLRCLTASSAERQCAQSNELLDMSVNATVEN